MKIPEVIKKFSHSNVEVQRPVRDNIITNALGLTALVLYYNSTYLTHQFPNVNNIFKGYHGKLPHETTIPGTPKQSLEKIIVDLLTGDDAYVTKLPVEIPGPIGTATGSPIVF